jgi:hypothetical protein
VVDEVGEDCCWGLVEVPVLIVRVGRTSAGALGETFEEGPGKESGSRLGEDPGTETATGEGASWLAILQKVRGGYTDS